MIHLDDVREQLAQLRAQLEQERSQWARERRLCEFEMDTLYQYDTGGDKAPGWILSAGDLRWISNNRKPPFYEVVPVHRKNQRCAWAIRKIIPVGGGADPIRQKLPGEFEWALEAIEAAIALLAGGAA